MARMSACWIVMALLGVTAVAQEPKPKFEVSSVKPFREQVTFSTVGQMSWGRQGGAVRVAGVTVETLIEFAYQIQPYQIVDGPDWMRKDRFSVDARPGAEASEDDAKRMMQSLLEDRFKLVTHEEQRDMKFYALVRARADGRLGPYIRQFGDGCTKEMSAEAKKAFPPPVAERGTPGWSFMRGDCSPGFTSVAQSLSLMFKDLPVRDETGLTGRFTYDVQYTSSGNGISDLKNALEEQLGLTLSVKQGPIAVRVVDSVSQPTEN